MGLNEIVALMRENWVTTALAVAALVFPILLALAALGVRF
jgi:hypothetical protein